jgi:hypothetical protein
MPYRGRSVTDVSGSTRIRAEVDERDIAKLYVKQQAVVTSQGFPGVASTPSWSALMGHPPHHGKRRSNGR